MSNSKFSINNLVSVMGEVKFSIQDPTKGIIEDFEIEIQDDGFDWSPVIIIDKKLVEETWLYHVACPLYKYDLVYYLIDVPEKFITKYESTLSEKDKSNICYFFIK